MFTNRNRSWEYFGIPYKGGEIYISALGVWKTRTYFSFLSMGKFVFFPLIKKANSAEPILIVTFFSLFSKFQTFTNQRKPQHNAPARLRDSGGEILPGEVRNCADGPEDLRSPLHCDPHSPSRLVLPTGPQCVPGSGSCSLSPQTSGWTMPGAGHTALPPAAAPINPERESSLDAARPDGGSVGAPLQHRAWRRAVSLDILFY